MSDDDEPPDLLAQVDQMIAGLKTRTKVIRAYYDGMVEQGFDAAEAFILTRDYAGKWSA